MFHKRPDLNFYSAADILTERNIDYPPIYIEKSLREECDNRKDFRFFARVALYTALTLPVLGGWGKQNYILAGKWGGMFQPSVNDAVLRGWAYLESLGLKEHWMPISIFDPILDATLDAAFGEG
jgi:hypothetical protein